MMENSNEANSLIRELSTGLAPAHFSGLKREVLENGGARLSQSERDQFIQRVIADALVSLAVKLDENETAGSGVRYEVLNEESDFVSPDDEIDPISGWLLAPEDRNLVKGKTTAPFPFDLYRGNHE